MSKQLTDRKAFRAFFLKNPIYAIWLALNAVLGGTLPPFGGISDESNIVQRYPVQLSGATGTDPIGADGETSLSLASTASLADVWEASGSQVKTKNNEVFYFAGAQVDIVPSDSIDTAANAIILQDAMLQGELTIRKIDNRKLPGGNEIRIPLSQCARIVSVGEMWRTGIAGTGVAAGEAGDSVYTPGGFANGGLSRELFMRRLGSRFEAVVTWDGGWTPPLDVKVRVFLHGFVVKGGADLDEPLTKILTGDGGCGDSEQQLTEVLQEMLGAGIVNNPGAEVFAGNRG